MLKARQDNTKVQDGTYKRGIMVATLEKVHLQFAVSAITPPEFLLLFFVCFLPCLCISEIVCCPDTPFSFSWALVIFLLI